MPHALNLTIPIRQDAETQGRLAKLKEVFATQVQPKIDNALRESQIVHSARVLVVDDKYLQVITVYDGDHLEYTEFFRQKLPDVFGLLFSLADKPPNSADLDDPNAFFEYAKSCQIRSLGQSSDGLTGTDGQSEGYLFSAFGETPVKTILAKLNG
jgi:hypothetical protein